MILGEESQEWLPALPLNPLAWIIHEEANNLVAQAFQPGQKTPGFLGIFILTKYFNELSCILRGSCIKWVGTLGRAASPSRHGQEARATGRIL
jgi:hypothetical protein